MPVASRAVDLLVVVGPSGAGKSTLITRLMKEFPGCFGYSISHTTRGPRQGEANGVSYHFVSPAEFEELVRQGKFLEHATVHNTSYGTSEMSVENVLAKNMVTSMDLDIKGAQRLRQNRRFRSMIVFVQAPDMALLEQRLRDRGTETEERIQTRLANARKEIDWHRGNSAFFDASFVNDDVDECYQQFRAKVVGSCFPAGVQHLAAVPTSFAAHAR